jgi:curved DNA-binding protein CbpA
LTDGHLETEEAHHAVREVYRKLASQLHPDREKDDDERRQKTAMMQRANAAYEKGDLLTLLNLQLECAQLDADALSELPEKRLERYNRALEEQARTLQAQKQEYCRDLADMLELPPTLLDFSESFVDARLDTLVRERNSQQAELSSWSAGLSDPARRDAIIDSLLKEMAARSKKWASMRSPQYSLAQSTNPPRRAVRASAKSASRLSGCEAALLTPAAPHPA